jgi:hypothetical protein
MNLEELKKYVRAATEYDWCGRKVSLRKLSAKDHLDIFGRAAAAETPADPETDKLETAEFHISIVERALVDQNGALVVANDEGRQWLRNDVAFDDLIALSEMVLKHSGYGAEKKTS